MYPNSEDVFARILATYEDEIVAFLRSQLSEEIIVEDLAQDIWAALAVALRRGHIQQERAWLYRTARNRLTDHWRRSAVRPKWHQSLDEAIETESHQTDDLEQAELWEEINEALDSLPATQRAVFVRNEVEGETLRSIAEDLDVPLKTVISRKGYARRRLQQLLADVYNLYFE